MKTKYTPRQTREALKCVLNLGFSYMDSFSKELAKLKLTPEEMQENDPKSERLQKANVIVSTMTLINDIMHPAHQMSLSLMDQKSIPFLMQVIRQHETAREKGFVSKGCPCESCALKKVDNATEENLTQDTKKI